MTPSSETLKFMLEVKNTTPNWSSDFGNEFAKARTKVSAEADLMKAKLDSMPSMKRITVEVLDKTSKSLNDMQSGINRLGTATHKVTGLLSNMTGMLGFGVGGGLAYGLYEGAKAGLAFNKSMDTVRQTLTASLGAYTQLHGKTTQIAAATKSLMAQTNTIAAKSPYSQVQTAQVAESLAAFQVPLNQIAAATKAVLTMQSLHPGNARTTTTMERSLGRLSQGASLSSGETLLMRAGIPINSIMSASGLGSSGVQAQANIKTQEAQLNAQLASAKAAGETTKATEGISQRLDKLKAQADANNARLGNLSPSQTIGMISGGINTMYPNQLAKAQTTEAGAKQSLKNMEDAFMGAAMMPVSQFITKAEKQLIPAFQSIETKFATDPNMSLSAKIHFAWDQIDKTGVPHEVLMGALDAFKSIGIAGAHALVDAFLAAPWWAKLAGGAYILNKFGLLGKTATGLAKISQMLTGGGSSTTESVLTGKGTFADPMWVKVIGGTGGASSLGGNATKDASSVESDAQSGAKSGYFSSLLGRTALGTVDNPSGVTSAASLATAGAGTQIGIGAVTAPLATGAMAIAALAIGGTLFDKAISSGAMAHVPVVGTTLQSWFGGSDAQQMAQQQKAFANQGTNATAAFNTSGWSGATASWTATSHAIGGQTVQIQQQFTGAQSSIDAFTNKITAAGPIATTSTRALTAAVTTELNKLPADTQAAGADAMSQLLGTMTKNKQITAATAQAVIAGITAQFPNMTAAAKLNIDNTFTTFSGGLNAISAAEKNILTSIGVASGQIKAPTLNGKALYGPAFGATGMRVPGPAMGDHIPLFARGGGVAGIVDGGELIVNQHTENDVDSVLGMFGMSLGGLVDNETRPHYALGGSVSLPNISGSAFLGQMAQAGLMAGAFDSGSTVGAYEAGLATTAPKTGGATAAGGTSGGSGSVVFPGGGGASLAAGWISSAIASTGVTPAASWQSMLMRQASRESSYDPNSVNNWDINAQHGNPSEGLLQVTGSNFRQYGPKGGNILNPVDNAIASIRYIEAKYGGMAGGLRFMIANGGAAYRGGGRIPRFATGGKVSKTTATKTKVATASANLARDLQLLRAQLAAAKKGNGLTGKKKVVNAGLVARIEDDIKGVQAQQYDLKYVNSLGTDLSNTWSGIQTGEGYATDTANLGLAQGDIASGSSAALGSNIADYSSQIKTDTRFKSSITKELDAAEKNKQPALVNILKSQLKAVNDAITQAQANKYTAMYEQAAAVITQNTNQAQANLSHLQATQHTSGTDLSGIQMHAQLYQGGNLTSADLATARSSTAALNQAQQAIINANQPTLAADEARAARIGPKNPEYASLEATIQGLQSTVDSATTAQKDNTDALAQMTQATFSAAAAMDNLAGGAVGFSYQGQSYAIGQSSDVLTGLGV